MKYFIVKNVVHKYPIPANCSARYTVGRLLDAKPDGIVECARCFEKEKQEN